MKININKISNECNNQKGFDSIGCYGCNCDDSCCKYGADFDKSSYELVIKFRHLIKMDNLFETDFTGDMEFLGNDSVRSLVSDGYCVFHKQEGKGCILYEIVNQNKEIDRMIIPSICRLFPLTWNNGELNISDNIPTDCNCLDIHNKTTKKILQTQKNELLNIMDIKTLM